MRVPCYVTFERCCVQVRGCFGRERVPVKPARPALSMWYAGILKTIAMAALYGPVSPAVYPLSLLSLAFQYYQKRVTFAMFKLSFPAMNERVVVTAMHLMSAGGVLHVFMVLTIALGLDATWLLICTLLSAGVWLVKSGAPLRLPCWLPLLRSHYCPEQPPALPVHCIERMAWGLSGRRATMLATKNHMLGVQAGQSPPAPQPEAYASPLDVLKLGVRARVLTCWSAMVCYVVPESTHAWAQARPSGPDAKADDAPVAATASPHSSREVYTDVAAICVCLCPCCCLGGTCCRPVSEDEPGSTSMLTGIQDARRRARATAVVPVAGNGGSPFAMSQRVAHEQSV